MGDTCYARTRERAPISKLCRRIMCGGVYASASARARATSVCECGPPASGTRAAYVSIVCHIWHSQHISSLCSQAVKRALLAWDKRSRGEYKIITTAIAIGYQDCGAAEEKRRSVTHSDAHRTGCSDRMAKIGQRTQIRKRTDDACSGRTLIGVHLCNE